MQTKKRVKSKQKGSFINTKPEAWNVEAQNVQKQTLKPSKTKKTNCKRLNKTQENTLRAKVKPKRK